MDLLERGHHGGVSGGGAGVIGTSWDIKEAATHGQDHIYDSSIYCAFSRNVLHQ